MSANDAPVGPAPRTRRIVGAVLLLLAVAAGLLVHFTLPDNAATDIFGDVLYAAAVSLALMIVAPHWVPPQVGFVAAVWCLAVELFQGTGLPAQWAADFPPITLVLGTVFDWRDLLMYGLTIVFVTVLDTIVWRRRR